MCITSTSPQESLGGLPNASLKKQRAAPCMTAADTLPLGVLQAWNPSLACHTRDDAQCINACHYFCLRKSSCPAGRKARGSRRVPDLCDSVATFHSVSKRRALAPYNTADRVYNSTQTRSPTPVDMKPTIMRPAPAHQRRTTSLLPDCHLDSALRIRSPHQATMVPRRRCKASVASGFAASEQASLPVASPTVVPVKDPFAERVQYNDSWLDLLFITVFTRKMAGQLDGVDAASDGRSGSTWDDFVRVSKGIMVGRNSVQQRSTVRDVLMSLFPPGAPAMFRRLFPPTKLSAELNARFASIGFVWLVGKMEVRLADVQVGPNEVRQQHSVVHIEKCRYLESSGCVGMCTNMCKVPTQKFFCDEFGLPLTLVPNFEDLSCDMIFGQAPPARLEDDPVYGQPCFPMNCSIVVQNVKAACPKTDTATLRKAVPASVVAAAQAAELKTALAAAAEAAARRAGMKA